MSGKDIIPFVMPLLGEAPRERVSLSFNQEIETIEREAYEKGFESGEQAGRTMGEQKAMVLLEKIESLMQEIVTLKERIIREMEPQIIELVVTIAKKILVKELTTNPDEIIEMTKEALMKLERTGQITIKINPSLYDLFVRRRPEFLSIHPDIAFDVDPSVSSCGSVVMGPVEDVVTDLDEQMKSLIKDMGDRLAGD